MPIGLLKSLLVAKSQFAYWWLKWDNTSLLVAKMHAWLNAYWVPKSMLGSQFPYGLLKCLLVAKLQTLLVPKCMLG
jgi:hypothetical protein